MKSSIFPRCAAALLSAAFFCAEHAAAKEPAAKLFTLPAGIERVTSVEGITEYALPIGLRVLLFPDPSRPIITVNITYKVGSRHKDKGETGDGAYA